MKDLFMKNLSQRPPNKLSGFLGSKSYKKVKIKLRGKKK